MQAAFYFLCFLQKEAKEKKKKKKEEKVGCIPY